MTAFETKILARSVSADRGATALLIALALVVVAVHSAFNGNYGFHRDELATLDDARYLAWGYVAYPPVTPFLARVALELFGASAAGLRSLGAVAQCAAIVLTGLMAHELGGRRWAQAAAALAVAIAPVSILWGALFQYSGLDYLWWVLAAYCAARLLRTEDPRWWLGIGVAIGLGMMTRYTMGFLALGITGGVLLFPWLGHVGVAAAIGLSGWVGAAALGVVLGRRHWLALDADARRRLPRIVLASAVMGICIEVCLIFVAPGLGLNAEGRAIILFTLVALGVCTYLFALQLLAVVTWKTLMAALRERV